MKDILMTAFHFPPQAGSSGILRTLNFVKYLPQHGWQPTVLTAHPRAYVETREDLLAMIPAGVKVIRGQAVDAARHLSIFRKYPRVLALPDRWSSWWVGAVRAGKAAIRERRPAVIWSTYPISTAHLIGLSLARFSGCPWVADFRDPMINEGYPSDSLQRRMWQAIEARVLAEASLCVFTTDRAAQAYRERYPFAAERCQVIENGYDEAVFEDVLPDRRGAGEGVLLLLHSGIIYPKDRNPGPFFDAVNLMLAAGELDRTRLCIRFRAPHHEAEVRELAAARGLQDVVEVAPPIPYQDALAEMMGADGLLVFQGSAFNAQIPAKIYEYLRAGRPLIAVVDPAGDTARALEKFHAVSVGDIDRKDDICRAIREWIGTSAAPGWESVLKANQANVQSFSRAAHTRRLAQLLDGLPAV